MEILEDKSLANYIFKKYSSNPKNWRFLVSTNTINNGFFDATISNPDESWQLKIDSIYKPIPIITGTKIDIDHDNNFNNKYNDNNLNKSNIPFGYRKIDPPKLMNLFKKISEEQDKIANKNIDIINKEFNSFLISLEPTVPTKGTDYLYGPFLFTNRNIIGKNNYQKNVSEKLSSHMKKKIKDRYPGYG